MSIEAIVWVLRNSESERAARLVLISIANNANNQGQESYPSIKTICVNSRLSERSVHYAIKELVGLGELIIEVGASRWGTNIYSLPKFQSFTNQLQGAKNVSEGAKDGEKSIQELHPIRPTEEPSKEKVQASPFMLPSWIPKESWDGFVEMRKKMRNAPWTDRARNLTITKLGHLKNQGENVGDCLDAAVERGWRGVFALSRESRQVRSDEIPEYPILRVEK